jgi:DNA-binding HxlR family transcriptional regulator
MTIKTETRRLKANSFKRSICPIACTLDLMGDKWTLLIIRDLFKGKHRYNQFHESGEGITTNILAERLQRLEKAGLVFKTPYQTRPVRYEYHLTDTGKTLDTVIWSIIEWANRQIPGTNKPKRSKIVNS